MVPKGKWYSVIISPHHRTDNWQLRIPGWGIWALGALLVVGCLALVSLGVVYRQYRIKAAEASRLRLQAQELAEATERIALLESELADLGEFQRHVREWLGLPPEVMVEATAFAPEAAWSESTGVVGQDGSSGWLWPADGWVSRGFDAGSARDPGHFGVDIVAARYASVRASRAGTVRSCGWDERYGNLVIIDHGDGFESRYGHNAELLVTGGESVEAGQEIAIIGNTGVSSAPHLHFEIRKSDQSIDPMSVLARRPPASRPEDEQEPGIASGNSVQSSDRGKP